MHRLRPLRPIVMLTRDSEIAIAAPGTLAAHLACMQQLLSAFDQESNLLDVANRTAAIVLDELTAVNLQAAQSPVKLTVIDPLVRVHGFAQLNIGLL